MERTFFIIGATGLIGRNVHSQLLQDDSKIIISPRIELSNPQATIKMLKEINPTNILQIGWTASGTKDYRNHPDNINWSKFTIELANFAVHNEIDFVGFGSMIELDEEADDKYSNSKRETLMELSNFIQNELITWLRPYYVFDEISKSPNLVKDTFEAYESGKSINLMKPYFRHDFIHVSDVASACQVAMKENLHGLVEIGSGECHTVLDFVKSLVSNLEIETDHIAVSASSQNKAQFADTARLKKIGWHPIATEKFFRGVKKSS